MADVRLTATNPADSSVVPVACNEKGELKLEEIPDQSFDGNLQGDLTVSGSAEFAGDVQSGGNARSGRNEGVVLRNLGLVQVSRQSGEVFTGFQTANDGSTSNATSIINADGSAKLAGGDFEINSFGGTRAIGGLSIGGTAGVADAGINLNSDGSARFAGGAAGFTAEGHLWCTTRRGDTVILDATSNGLASWVPYTPPSRLTELQDKWAEKDGILPVPHESSQDEPETTQ